MIQSLLMINKQLTLSQSASASASELKLTRPEVRLHPCDATCLRQNGKETGVSASQDLN